MKILFPIIALLLVGCAPKPEEMVVGKWVYHNGDSRGYQLKFRADGIFEEERMTNGGWKRTFMGEWKIDSRGQILATHKYEDYPSDAKWFEIVGPSKLLFVGFDDNFGLAESKREEVGHETVLYRVVE